MNPVFSPGLYKIQLRECVGVPARQALTKKGNMSLTRPRILARLMSIGAARMGILSVLLALPLATAPVAAGPMAMIDAASGQSGRSASEQAAGEARVALLPPLVGMEQKSGRHVTSGLALEGFDPVTYFLGGAPQPGRPALEAVWGGFAWRFSSEANRAAFLSRPEAYIPRFGGFDAKAMGEGRLVEGGARIAAVKDGKLYLFHSRASRDDFLDDARAVQRAEQVWREQRARLARL